MDNENDGPPWKLLWERDEFKEVIHWVLVGIVVRRILMSDRIFFLVETKVVISGVFKIPRDLEDRYRNYEQSCHKRDYLTSFSLRYDTYKNTSKGLANSRFTR